MSASRVVAIRLKVPDNTAFTALVALQRLGVEVARVRRAEVWLLDDAGEASTLVQRVCADETIFNPQLHEVELRHESSPRAGELWVREAPPADNSTRIAGVKEASRVISWTLSDSRDIPAPRAVLEQACDALLCNPAIEEAEFG